MQHPTKEYPKEYLDTVDFGECTHMKYVHTADYPCWINAAGRRYLKVPIDGCSYAVKSSVVITCSVMIAGSYSGHSYEYNGFMYLDEKRDAPKWIQNHLKDAKIDVVSLDAADPMYGNAWLEFMAACAYRI